MEGFLLLLSSVLLATSLASPVEKRSVFGPKCYDMTSGFCGSIGYTQTSICTSDHAVMESVLQSFQPLVDSGCAEDLKPFLCFAHLPICIQGDEETDKPNTVIPPCRSMCERVESKCGLLLKAVGISWPETLDCTQYSDEQCASLPASPPTPSPECDKCKVKRKSSVGFNKMCKTKPADKTLYAQVKVLSRVVSGDVETVFYHAQVQKTFTDVADVKVSQDTDIWIISSSTEQCDCHQLKTNNTYVVGLTVESTYGAPFYYLGNDAVVMTYKDKPNFLAKLDKCSS